MPDDLPSESAVATAPPPLHPSRGGTASVARAYQGLVLAAFALLPLGLITYLQLFQAPTRLFHNHLFHELAIGLAILIGAGVTWVAAACYRSSREPFLYWMTLALLGFTLIYAPHGLLTRWGADNPPLFLLFGPASRLIMMALLFVALIHQHAAADTPDRAARSSLWWPWAAGFIGVDLLIVAAALSAEFPHGSLRVLLETGALLMSALSLTLLLSRPQLSSLMLLFCLAICLFAQSSISFFVAAPWNHQWWLAHAIFASGFLLLGYGLASAYRTTRSLSRVFSVEEWARESQAANARAEEALRKLQASHRQLAEQACTESLTGLFNRRHFLQEGTALLDKAIIHGQPVTLMVLDLDSYKPVNDRWGHDAGDLLVLAFSELLQDHVRQQSPRRESRPADLIGQINSEKFAVIFAGMTAEQAQLPARRLVDTWRKQVVTLPDGETVATDMSLGLASFPEDGSGLNQLLRQADQRRHENLPGDTGTQVA